MALPHPAQGFHGDPYLCARHRGYVRISQTTRVLFRGKSCASVDGAQIKELYAVGTPEFSATVNFGEILRANVEFHRRLSGLAGNQRVTSQLSLTLDYVTR